MQTITYAHDRTHIRILIALLVSSNSPQGYVGLFPKNINSFWIKLFYFILEVASIDHYTYLSIPVVITISESRKKIYNQKLGAYEKQTILNEVVFILFLSYITVTCRHTGHRFLRQRLLLKHQNVI